MGSGDKLRGRMESVQNCAYFQSDSSRVFFFFYDVSSYRYQDAVSVNRSYFVSFFCVVESAEFFGDLQNDFFLGFSYWDFLCEAGDFIPLGHFAVCYSNGCAV